MRPYSDFPVQRTWQIVADVAAVLLMAFFVWLGTTLSALILAFGELGVRLEDAGAGFRETMTDLGDALGGIPIIGSGIRGPFDGASGAGSALESAGQATQDAIAAIATGVGLGVSLVPIAVILVCWLVPRIRFARRSAAIAAMAGLDGGLDLLALRALATRPVRSLAGVAPRAADGWRRGDAGVVRELASLELAAAGVRLKGDAPAR